MKTSVIIKRVLGSYDVRQESKDGMFNANDLLSAYNKQAEKKKRLDNYMKRPETQETADVLLKMLNEDHSNRVFLPDNVIRTSKAVKTERGGTWMHPYQFMDFAMWLSVKFKLICIAWVYDNVIRLRNEVGDDYKELTSAVRDHLQPTNVKVYKDEIGMINKLVFGTPGRGQRDDATEEQLVLMKVLQKADMRLMAEGKTYSERMASLHRMKELL